MEDGLGGLRCFAVAEKGGKVSAAIVEGLRRWKPGCMPDGLPLLMQTGEDLLALCAAQPELLVLADSARAPGRGESLPCGHVLLPGERAGIAARCLAPRHAISYGMSSRDTLTLSSTASGQVVLALQRDLTTLEGKVLERQEIPLRPWVRADPATLLAAASTLLLLGISPEVLLK